MIFEKIEKDAKDKKIPGEKHFYTGDVGNLPHDEKCYKAIAKQILDQLTDDKDKEGKPKKDEKGNPVKKWPEPANVAITRGKKEVDAKWVKCASQEDMRNRF